MNRILSGWRSDKLKTALTISWLLTVFFGFFGSTVLLVKIPGLPALYPYRVLVPVTTVLYLCWAIREKRNPWKAATFAQRICYLLCAILIIHGTLSLRRAIDFQFTFTLWITLCFNLVFLPLMLELCSDRQMFIDTVHCALVTLGVHIVMGIIEVFRGGFFTKKFREVLFFFGGHYTSPSVSAGNPNDYAMMLVFMLALVLLYWAWRGHAEKISWIPIVLIPPIYFLISATYGRLCELSFWIVLAVFTLCVLASKKHRFRVLVPTAVLLAAVVILMAMGHDFPSQEEEKTQDVSVFTEVIAANQQSAQVSESQEQTKTVLPSGSVMVENTEQAQQELKGSGATRLDLLLHAWNCFKESKGMGVGIGNTAQLAKATAARRGGVWAIHCFLARMTADFGIWFLIPLLLVAFKLIQLGMEYTIAAMKKRDWVKMTTGALYLASVLIYPIASTAPGDAQNSVPMWLYLGALVLLPVHLKETEALS